MDHKLRRSDIVSALCRSYGACWFLGRAGYKDAAPTALETGYRRFKGNSTMRPVFAA